MRRLTVLLALTSTLLGTARSVEAADGAHHVFRYLNSYGSAQSLETMTFSPDSTQLAVAVGGKVDFIDPGMGRITGQHKAEPFSITYTKTGNLIYMISRYGSVLLDTLTGSELKANYQETPGYIGLRLEKESGRLLVKSITEGGPVAAAGAISIDDELIGVADGRNGRMSDVTGRDVSSAARLFKGPAGSYLQLKVLPRGEFSQEMAETHVVRRQPGKVVGNTISFSTFAPARIDENVAWCMSDGRYEFRDASTGSPIAQFRPIDIESIGQYAVSPDQKKFAVISRNKKDGSENAVEVFDIATQDRLAYMPSPQESYYGIAFAADNNRVLVATWDSIEIADTAKGKFVARLDLGWKPPTKKENEKDRRDGGFGGSPLSGIFGYSGPREEDRKHAPRNLVSEMAVSSNDIVATADLDGHVKLWDLNSGVLLKELPKNPDEETEAIGFSPDGRWLAYFIDGVLHVVDVSDIQPHTTDEPELPQVDEVLLWEHSLPDGRLVEGMAPLLD